MDVGSSSLAGVAVRVAIGGKGWVAVRAAKLLDTLAAIGGVDVGVEIVRNQDDKGADSWLPSLLLVAQAKGWPVHAKAEEADLGSSDVFLSLQYDRIVDCAALGGARAYNLHFANLPKYRGSLTSTLPIRRGENVAGVTLHVLVQEVDAGPVIASRSFELPPFYSAYDLYRAYHNYGFELLKANLHSVLSGTVQAIAQDDAAATAFMRRSVDFADIELYNFDRDANEVRDYCRSLIFRKYSEVL